MAFPLRRIKPTVIDSRQFKCACWASFEPKPARLGSIQPGRPVHAQVCLATLAPYIMTDQTLTMAERRSLVLR